MLVLTRKNGESIRVADGIIFTILECGKGQVKVGISAPAHLSIHREEVYLRIREENLAAAQASNAVQALMKGVPKSLLKLVKGSGHSEGERGEPGQ